MPFPRPSLLELISRIESDLLSRVETGVGFLRRSMLRVLARVFGGAVNSLYGFIDFLARQMFAATATAEYLDLHGEKWGINRLQPTYAEGQILCTGVDGTLIPEGTLFQNENGGQYLTQNAATIASGQILVAVKAEAPGASYNRLYMAILTLLVPIEDVNDQATVGPENLTGGSDLETDDAMRIRLLSIIQTPGTGGNDNDYIVWTKETPTLQVTRVWVKPEYLGPMTVGIFFILDNQSPIFPSTAQISQARAQILIKAPNTARVSVFSPVEVKIGLALIAQPNTAAVREAIRDSLLAFFKNTDVGMTIYKTMLDESIGLATGEITHTIQSMTVDAEEIIPPGDIFLGGDQLPRLGFLYVNGVLVYTDL